MENSVERFIKSVTLRAKAALMIVLGEKVIDILKEDKNVFSLSRGLLDKSWLWEESLGAYPREIFEYLESSREDFVERQDLSLVCQFDDEETPEPLLTAIQTIINTGCIVVKYAYETMDSERMPPTIIGETFEDRDIPIGIDGVIEMKLVDEAWIERAMSYLMSNHRSDDPNALGEPINREELMSLA
jgi:Immunity protein Imm6